MKFQFLSIGAWCMVIFLASCATSKVNPPTFQKMTISEGDSVVEFRITDKSVKSNPSHRYFWFKQQKIHASVGNYSGNLLDQEYAVYNLNGDLLEKGYFENGLKSKTWTNWEEGEKSIRQEYVNGSKEGEYQELVNGKLIKEGQYKNDLKDGKFRTILSDTSYVEVYKNGILVIKEEKEKSKGESKVKKVKEKKETNEE